jgi:outer membrane immunogenic protein
MRRQMQGRQLIALAAGALITATHVSSAQAQNAPGVVWTGFYAGVHAGGVFGDTNMHLVPGGYDTVFAPGSVTQANSSPSGFTGGGLAGFNYQFASSLVLGAEAEIGGSTASATSVTVSTPGWPATNKLSEDLNARFRMRMGYAIGEWMPFIAGGLSLTYANLDLTFPCSGVIYTDHKSKTLTGFNVGAGVEYAISSHISTRLEYIFDDYGSPQIATTKPDWNDRKFTTFNNSTVRMAISYRF